MIFKYPDSSLWIVAGLSLSLSVLGGLGSVRAATSSAPATPASISMISMAGLPAAEATQTPHLATQSYVVESGDTLWLIAAKFYGNGAKYPLIQRANNLPDAARLRTGQTLLIPSAAAVDLPPTQTPTLALATPPFVPSQTPPPSTASPSTEAPSRSPTPMTSTPTSVPISSVIPSNSGLASVIPVLGVIVSVLSAICLLGSVVCAALSYDIYRRSRHYADRRYIRSRVRAGL